MAADYETVSQFLRDNQFTGYQRVPLPFGLAIPGNDRQPTADRVFSGGVIGKTVLDVGTYYGYFPYEAMRRGAARAVGVEPDVERYSVAHQVAGFHNDVYRVVHGSAEDLGGDEQFDLVLMLGLLHHLADPVSVVLAGSRLCRGHVVLEFCTPSDPAYLEFLFAAPSGRRHRRPWPAYGASLLLGLLCKRLPLLAVGNRPNHRVFYFSRDGFYNLFVTHHGAFEDIRFYRSPVSAHRVIAFCRVRSTDRSETAPNQSAP